MKNPPSLASRPHILIVNGPNLNLLGLREPELYGSSTYQDLVDYCQQEAEKLGVNLTITQSNHEGELIDIIQNASQSSPVKFSGIIANLAGYSHTSVALLDALLASPLPVVEVHLTNIHRREAFRNHSYTAQGAHGVVCGFGFRSYSAALYLLAKQ